MPTSATIVTNERWWKRPVVLWPAAGLATAATVLLAFTFGIMPWQRSEEPAFQALVAAVGSERTFVPRLTGGFAHGPVRGAVRSGSSGSASQSPDIRIAAARIEKETAAQPSAQALHVLGIAELVIGELDRSVVALEDAATQQPTDARILNDLASAYLVRGEQARYRNDMSKALAALNRALEVDRTSPEVLFNRAYALERLSLIPEAREAWQAYLTIDNRSGWADEARARLRVLNPKP
jgi:tetratricopeptide (TPR) repeat protein